MTPAAAATRLLIVNADDFGLTDGVCRAIVRAHREGIVTSTSALAVGPAFHRCASMLDDVPELGVGVHLAAVGEDPPLLSAREIALDLCNDCTRQTGGGRQSGCV